MAGDRDIVRGSLDTVSEWRLTRPADVPGQAIGQADYVLIAEIVEVDRFEQQASEHVQRLADDLEHLVSSRGMSSCAPSFESRRRWRAISPRRSPSVVRVPEPPGSRRSLGVPARADTCTNRQGISSIRKEISTQAIGRPRPRRWSGWAVPDELAVRAMCASWVSHSKLPGRWRSASPGRRWHRARAMALRVPRGRALGDLHPRRRRRESNGVLDPCRGTRWNARSITHRLQTRS